MPFRLFAKRCGDWHERGIVLQNDTLAFAEKPTTGAIINRLSELSDYPNYRTVMKPKSTRAPKHWLAPWAETLSNGLLLIADYGFGRREYYHPQRIGGTMMCHHQHMADTNPLEAPGDKDITAHVDFSAIAEAGLMATPSLPDTPHKRTS